ncbi:hypothetical protein ScPMuIL_009587 [Solemya velum]
MQMAREKAKILRDKHTRAEREILRKTRERLDEVFRQKQEKEARKVAFKEKVLTSVNKLGGPCKLPSDVEKLLSGCPKSKQLELIKNEIRYLQHILGIRDKKLFFGKKDVETLAGDLKLVLSLSVQSDSRISEDTMEPSTNDDTATAPAYSNIIISASAETENESTCINTISDHKRKTKDLEGPAHKKQKTCANIDDTNNSFDKFSFMKQGTWVAVAYENDYFIGELVDFWRIGSSSLSDDMEFAEFIKSPTVDGVILRKSFCKPVEGTLCITGHHLILSSRTDHKEELWLLHSNVDSVEKKLSGSGGMLTVRCKNFTYIQLEIPQAEDCLNVASSLEQLSHIDDISLQYPFFYRPMFDILEDGWQAFLPENEFNRFKECSDEWRLSYVNKEYGVCPSYPHAVVVPRLIDDETLVRVASFRHHSRFPVLSYFHRDTKAVMMRAGQPMIGQSNRRCKEDEKLVNAVLGIGKRGYIVDTRSQSVAKMAQTKGGGYEPEAHYPQWRRIHQSIERRHAFHDSLIKMIEACNDSSSTMDKWLSKLESSNWMTHIKDILSCACVVAQCIDKEGASVLVHGSEGFDTTLLVSSIVQLILDQDCRTISGFEALVEREWLQAGHPFSDRCGKSAFAITKSRQESPVIVLFIDCVWQIWQQFPCSFEFNEDFLKMLFEHAYSSQFGTFLCNNEKERKERCLAKRTVSLWSYMNRPEVLENHLNSMYDPNPQVIWPSVASQSLTLWTGLYQQSLVDPGKQQEAWGEIKKIREHDKYLRAQVAKLRRQLASLEREALTAGVVIPCGLDVEVVGKE